MSKVENRKLIVKMKAMSKFELAEAAGVSAATFRRWLRSDMDYLLANGVTPKTKILPPKVVQYLCKKYCIDIP
jgi:hypothetical protein